MREKIKSECEEIINFMRQNDNRGNYNKFSELIGGGSPGEHVQELRNMGLIKLFNPDLPSSGYYILSEEGEGFTTFKEYEKYRTQRQNKEDKLKVLDIELKQLQIDNLKYQKTIQSLEEELKISSLLKNWWWLITSAIGLGIVVGKYFFL